MHRPDILHAPIVVIGFSKVKSRGIVSTLIHISLVKRWWRVGLHRVCSTAGNMACACLIHHHLRALSMAVLSLPNVLLDSSPPVILYFIICTSWKMLRNFWPPAQDNDLAIWLATQNFSLLLLLFILLFLNFLLAQEKTTIYSIVRCK